tara:strand:+ start:1292 stop:1510 length:219 start_codon:yes stop_codon:yes gene_type:complete
MSIWETNLYSYSPTGFIGFWVLFVGLIFTSIMFYFVFFRLNDANASYKDRERRDLEKVKQKERIARLYPNKN